ncbi:HAD phosphatase [Pisolithus croceorrhizus]|nr:HAD phosphatase [Pisolithus croceorrhizus]
MPLNIPGILAPFQLLWNPRIILPHVIVTDIRQLDFPALLKAGYRGAVFDKDNCLTIPYKDTLVPELQDSWRECREAFGECNVLIVSNSAGTRDDPGGIQAESVSHHLSVPVLYHGSPKPAYRCISAIRAYFSSLPNPIQDHELVVVGDRVFTDVVMANRMKRRVTCATGEPEKTSSIRDRENGPLAVWTNGVWQKESMVMRWIERCLVDVVARRTNGKHELSDSQEVFTRLSPQPKVTQGKIPLIMKQCWSLLRKK